MNEIIKRQIGNATLYCGDCRKVMPLLADVDLVITDPPYGETTHKGARTANSLAESIIDFAPITTDDLLLLAKDFVALAKRWVVMTCAWQHAAALEGHGLVRLGVWVKPNGAPQFTGDRPGVGWEAVAILHRDGKKRWNGGGHHAVWNCPIEQGKHPTQKPLKLVSGWVAAFSDPGELVCDPFMGSGTTGVACAKLGRRFVGIEQDPKYFDLACKRIEAAYSQPDLFLEPAKGKAVKTDDLFTFTAA